MNKFQAKNDAEVMDKVGKCIAWYHDNSSNPGAMTPAKLIQLRIALSTYSYRISEQVAEYKRDYEAAYFRRKLAYAKAMDFLSTENRKKSREEKRTSAEIQSAADVQAQTEKRNEIAADYNYNLAKGVLRQINEILGTLNSHVSWLKSEKSNTTQTQT